MNNRLDQDSVMKLKVLVRSESVGGYSVSILALPGCYSEGETLEEALDNIREAALLWLQAVEDRAAALARSGAAATGLEEIEL
jgi:predicted RNase H-like HicB family nuclease